MQYCQHWGKSGGIMRFFLKYLDVAVGALTPEIFCLFVFPSDRYYSKIEKYYFIKPHLNPMP